MSRALRTAAVAAVAALAVLSSAGIAGASTTPAASTLAPGSAATTTGFAPSAKEWLLADADTGSVLASAGEHVPVRPASVAKIITAYLAMRDLPADATVPVGADAAGEEAMKMNMKVGDVWPLDQTLHALLMVSANDAAVALADRVSGTTTAFGQLADRVASQLGATDPLLFDDPAGLDDSFQLGRGDLISAYDLAVFARAAMTIPEFRTIVGTRHYQFQGVDGAAHELPNHNRLLAQDRTVIGIKPGYTQLAGQTLVTEAVRDGRTMLVVLLDDNGTDIYSDAEGLFNQGFATPVADEAGGETLPPVRTPSIAASSAPTAAVSARAKPPRTAVTHSYSWKRLELFAVAGVGGTVYFRRRSVRRRREARRAFNPAARLG